MATNPTTPAALRGAGRLAFRTGGFPHHAVSQMRSVLGRDLTTEERTAILDGWAAERGEVVL